MSCGMNNSEILRRLNEAMAVMEAAGKRIDELKAENKALRQVATGSKRDDLDLPEGVGLVRVKNGRVVEWSEFPYGEDLSNSINKR